MLALISLIFIGWSAYLQFTYPHDGIVANTNNWVIQELDDFGKYENLLQEGDIIDSVDGMPPLDALPFYGDKSPGESIDFVIIRNGEPI